MVLPTWNTLRTAPWLTFGVKSAGFAETTVAGATPAPAAEAVTRTTAAANPRAVATREIARMARHPTSRCGVAPVLVLHVGVDHIGSVGAAFDRNFRTPRLPEIVAP